jgi:hypothetical protein
MTTEQQEQAPVSHLPGDAIIKLAAMDEIEVVPPGQRRFGRYTLFCRLATGGMASLYLARYTGPDGFEKLVAIKRIHKHLSSEQNFVRMFSDEARLAARINHPNVAQVLELGSYDGSYFIAMEYVDGENLAVLLKKTKIPLPICARLISNAALGLHSAHELRDTSGNLLRADVFPLGTLLFETSTRRRLFKGESEADTIEKVLFKEVPSPALYVKDYPEQLAEIVLKALQRPPERRYQTAHDIHIQLEDFLSKSPNPVLPSTIAELMKRVFADRIKQKTDLVHQCLEADPEAEPSYHTVSGSWAGSVVSNRRNLALAIGGGIAVLVGLLFLGYFLFKPVPPPPVVAPVVQPKTVLVFVKALPADAVIEFDGKPVANPYRIERDPEKRTVDVKVTATDHVPHTFEVSLEEGGRWMVHLQHLVKPSTQPVVVALDAGVKATPPPSKVRKPGGRKPGGRKPGTKKKVINNLFKNPYGK